MVVSDCAHCQKATAPSKCSSCGVRYCNAECQNIHWPKHKEHCKKAKHEYEWLIDCFRMRMDDGVQWMGEIRSLYRPCAMELPKNQWEPYITLEFILFCKLAQTSQWIDDRTSWWDWDFFLIRAPKLIAQPFKKLQAIDKYGHENVYLHSKVPSLRLIGDNIYQRSGINGLSTDSRKEQKVLMRLKMAGLTGHPEDSAEKYPIVDQRNPDMYKLDGTPGNTALDTFEGSILDDIGGIKAWRALAKRVRVEVLQCKLEARYASHSKWYFESEDGPWITDESFALKRHVTMPEDEYRQLTQGRNELFKYSPTFEV